MGTINFRTRRGAHCSAAFAILVTSLLLSGCGGGDDGPETESDDSSTATSDDGTSDNGVSDETSSDEPSAPPATGDPGPGAFDPDYQTSDAFFTRLATPLASRIHAQQRTWFSVNIADLPPEGPFTVPEGTVAIKAEYDADGTNFVTVVMVKREAGYDPDGNDWYYEAREPDGTLASSPTPGPASLCKSCHADGADTDFLLGFNLEN